MRRPSSGAAPSSGLRQGLPVDPPVRQCVAEHEARTMGHQSVILHRRRGQAADQKAIVRAAYSIDQGFDLHDVLVGQPRTFAQPWGDAAAAVAGKFDEPRATHPEQVEGTEVVEQAQRALGHRSVGGQDQRQNLRRRIGFGEITHLHVGTPGPVTGQWHRISPPGAGRVEESQCPPRATAPAAGSLDSVAACRARIREDLLDGYDEELEMEIEDRSVDDALAGVEGEGARGAIKRITQRPNPRVCRVVALPAPNDREKTQW